ncbi:MAG: chromosome segregation protein SMC [Myxococcota bacterium]
MKIKKLEIAGFKSFAERATLHFGAGISGVVGPNGCGKSNIVDAIRWCMGEMSAKHLRGRAMQDIIFAGSDSRGPMGLAEVTLTFDNDGDVPPQYAAYPEIAVTRRLHRDGTSEYLLNKVPVRLRDITDMFLGTGVGTRAYSIIEQGRIGFIVTARPEDRRSLIEEVAGITKFKARKKTAERRMLATEQNLLRVNDIVSELERQLGSLRRQAKKAERYKELRAEQSDLELHAAALDLLGLMAFGKAKDAERGRLEQHMGDAARTFDGEETGLEGDKLRLLEEERRLQDEQQASAAAEAKLAALERDLAHWRTQLTEAEQRSTSAAEDVQEASTRLAEVQGERARLETQTRELAEQTSDDDFLLAQTEQEVADLIAQRNALARELETLRRAGIDTVHVMAQQRTLAANLERQHSDLAQRLAQLEREHDEVHERHLGAVARHLELESRVAESRVQLGAWRTRLAELRAELEDIEQVRAQQESELLQLRGELAERRSRLQSLEQIAQKLEGYSSGVRALMGVTDAQGQAGASTPVVAGLRSPLADIVEVPTELEAAIEAALGERLQYVLVDDHRAGAEAISYLKGHGAGRGGFVPVDVRLERALGAVPSASGVLGAALARVHVRPGLEAIAEAVLGDVLLVESLEAGLSLWRSGSCAGWRLVTLAGEVLEPAGMLSGGAADGAGLLARRREIRELGDDVERMEAALVGAQAHFLEIEQQRLQREVDLQQLDKDVRALEIELAEAGKDLQAASEEKRRAAERLEVLAYERLQREEELTAIAHERTVALAAAAQAQEEQTRLDEAMLALQRRQEGEQGSLAARSEALTVLKVQRASRAEKLASVRATVERLTQAAADLERRTERDRRAIAEGHEQVVQLRENIAAGEQDLGNLATHAATRKQILGEARARYEVDQQRLGEREQVLRERRRSGEKLQHDLLHVKMELQRTELERQSLIEHVRERHDLDLLRIMGDYHLRPLPGPEAKSRREDLERQIKAMGPINLMAIEEHAEVEGRYEFLRRQRDDLSQALDSLKRAIQRINRTSRERFKEAFEAVNEMFQQLFPRLFRGGEARLELTESDDLLEAGVDIVVQPPGKKAQSVTLLSGGEKALTATALVFAIFLIKPSPFCILDEVDAPLDDANVGRFNELLREISKLSQFIVITHNKSTMTEADRLYGITMEEPGMSKVVAVEFEERDARAA